MPQEKQNVKKNFQVENKRKDIRDSRDSDKCQRQVKKTRGSTTQITDLRKKINTKSCKSREEIF